MPTIPLRNDFDAERVRVLAARSDDGNQARRLLSMAAIYDGMDRACAAGIGGMDRQTLRDWVHRFNAGGPAGLIDRKPNGALRRLTPSQMAALSRAIEGDLYIGVDGLCQSRYNPGKLAVLAEHIASDSASGRPRIQDPHRK